MMSGYRNLPEQTADALDADGWLHTGDIATIDADGFVTIVDRKKELIINAAGKNMSPANIEAALKTGSPLIGTLAAHGCRRTAVRIPHAQRDSPARHPVPGSASGGGPHAASIISLTSSSLAFTYR